MATAGVADMLVVATATVADMLIVGEGSIAATSVGTGSIAAASTDAAFAGSGASIRTWRMATMAAAALG